MRKNLLKEENKKGAGPPAPPVAAVQKENEALIPLQVSEIRYRRLFEAARDGVLLIDPVTARITDVNPFMIEFLGYPRAEFIGRELWEIGRPEDEQANREKYRQLQQEHFVRYENLPMLSKTGQPRQVEVVANLYRENTNLVIQCNIRDITERKHAEKELRDAKREISQHAAQLEQTIHERTGQLRETIGELETFSYSVTHDLRAPLRALRGFSQILLQEHAAQLDETGKGHLERINQAAQRMDVLIQEVLTYTRVLRADIKNERVDLNAIVRETIGTYPELQAADVGIHIQGKLLPVWGNVASMGQCISNLLTNAVKFVAPGIPPRVKIWTQPKGGDVVLWIEDNGIGIADSDQARIFKMFERVERPVAYEGNGMGLAIVCKAVERMGGKMGVESAAGLGSKFWIQLRGRKS